MSKLKKPTKSSTTSTSNWTKVVAAGALGAFAILVAAFFLYPSPPSPTSEEILQSSRFALTQGDFDNAEALAGSIADNDSKFGASRLVAGEAATRAGTLEQALAYYQQIQKDSEAYDVGLYAQAELLRTLCRWQPAIDAYSMVLQRTPSNSDCRERLAFILGASGQRWESVPLLMQLLKENRWSIESLAILTDIERPIEQLDLIKQCMQVQPNDPVVRLARAAHHLVDGEPEMARKIVEPLTQSQPDLLSAHEQLGESLLMLNDWPSLLRWSRTLPTTAERSATIWFVRSQMAKSLGRLELAAGCLVKVLQIAPEHRQASYQLGQVLAKLQSSNAESIMKRAELQLSMSQQLDKILASNGGDGSAMKIVSEGCFELGRFREAWAWAVTSSAMHGKPVWASNIVKSVETRLPTISSRTVEEYEPVRKFGLSEWLKYADLNVLNSIEIPASMATRSPPSQVQPSNFQFKQVSNLGLDFTYANGDDPQTKGVRMFEQTGGGVGSLDYDNDGWPDIYFTQGSQWKTGENLPTPTEELHDSLFRNRDGRSFEDVALRARIEERDYSQGVAVGDLNNDGFEDLLIGNIGVCRLFLNNGDGTFMDATTSLPGQNETWTTSCAIVDINSDGLADIYRVNYVQGKDVYSLICNGKGCSPSVFDGAPNQCWINDGVGSFVPVKKADGEAKLSKGLGILAFRIEGENSLSLFVSNDQVRNFLLTVGSGSSGEIELNDEALLRGLALSMDGLAFACMGVAADDVDRNGTVDLFVTNFADEPRTLYLQDSSGLFADSTTASGMQSANNPYVGWGTQFIDIDRDSWPDVVVVNGHVDDYTDEGKGFAMPAQVHRNLGNGRFELKPSSTLGDFFQKDHLGRGLAKLDWNRDGLFDFAVSIMNSPACLVSNVSKNAGNYVNVRLVGVRSARVPIGAIVTVHTSGGSWKKQLTGGDGFQCSNERCIQFGLGEVVDIQRVTIEWPSGAKDELVDVPVNSAILCVEGCSQFTVQTP